MQTDRPGLLLLFSSEKFVLSVRAESIWSELERAIARLLLQSSAGVASNYVPNQFTSRPERPPWCRLNNVLNCDSNNVHGDAFCEA